MQGSGLACVHLGDMIQPATGPAGAWAGWALSPWACMRSGGSRHGISCVSQAHPVSRHPAASTAGECFNSAESSQASPVTDVCPPASEPCSQQDAGAQMQPPHPASIRQDLLFALSLPPSRSIPHGLCRLVLQPLWKTSTLCHFNPPPIPHNPPSGCASAGQRREDVGLLHLLSHRRGPISMKDSPGDNRTFSRVLSSETLACPLGLCPYCYVVSLNCPLPSDIQPEHHLHDIILALPPPPSCFSGIFLSRAQQPQSGAELAGPSSPAGQGRLLTFVPHQHPPSAWLSLGTQESTREMPTWLLCRVVPLSGVPPEQLIPGIFSHSQRTLSVFPGCFRISLPTSSFQHWFSLTQLSQVTQPRCILDLPGSELSTGRSFGIGYEYPLYLPRHMLCSVICMLTALFRFSNVTTQIIGGQMGFSTQLPRTISFFFLKEFFF